MPLTNKQIHLASLIDEHVKQLYANGGTDEDLLRSLYDHMDTFKQVMDTSTKMEIQQLCQRYDGFYTFAKLLEDLASGLADGTISVPK